MGIKVLEGFGLTETTPITNANKPTRIKPGTVGPAVKDTTIKIGEGGEILIKGPQVMKGYYKNEAATKEAFTSDGFFRTGDIGEIDEDGYLKITGRIKDLIITSGGKNISPQNIENTLIASRFIEQLAVIGDNRKYLSALIVPSFATLEAWAKKKNIPFTGRQDLISEPEVQKLFEHEIEQYMKDYSRVEQIRKFTLLETEWSQDTGELTPTMKVKRKIINQKYTQRSSRCTRRNNRKKQPRIYGFNSLLHQSAFLQPRGRGFWARSRIDLSMTVIKWAGILPASFSAFRSMIIL